MNRAIDEMRVYFDTKDDVNDFVALDYLVNNRPISEQEYDALIWSGVEDAMEFEDGQDVLEIGSGVGLGLRRLESRSRRLVGTDLSSNLLKRYAGSAKVLPIAAHQIDFPPESFDRIFMVSVALLFPDFDYFKDVIRKALHQLKRGGVLGVFDQYLHVNTPHPRYLSIHRNDLSEFLGDINLPYSVRAQNRQKRKISNRFDIVIYKD